MIAKVPRSKFHYGWIVASVTFLTLLVAAGMRSTPGVLIVPLAAIVLRFGRLATIAVLELGMTGLVLAFLQLKAPLNLITTPYGKVLLIKSSVLLLTLLLVVLTMRLQSERRTRWWRAETALLAIIIALAGLLVSLPPPIT